MKSLKLTVLVLFLAAAALPTAWNRTAHSQTSTTASADQANVASDTDATATSSSGNYSTEGVATNDTTTYTYRTDADPTGASGGTKTATPSTTEMSATSESDATVMPAEDGSAYAITACPTPAPTAAPTGFDNKTNGMVGQATFDADRVTFEEVDVIADGLGPVYNAQACSECHQDPVTGAISQITELRAGHNATDAYGNTIFVDAPGGSLINDRATNSKAHERVPPLYTAGIIGGGAAITASEGVRTFRTSLNTLGDGFVEAIADGTLVAIANNQPGTTGGEIQGQAISVPVLEAGNAKRVARFGWKDQHASLLSFSGDAYLNEIGITNFLVLKENTSLGRFVGFGSGFDPVPDNQPCDANANIICGEDTAQDVKVFARFMRATKAPPRDQDIINKYLADVTAGAQIFASMPTPNGPTFSCSVCHVPSILTAKPCTVINGGAFTVPTALGSKIIRPFGDFLLHDVGTGDGIVQNGGQTTRRKVRTAPLWGVRTRTRLMHDGASLTFSEAILRHAGEATSVINNYKLLTATQKRQLITFLESL
ncbi:MAG TPA: di-heme oxidoredictase family protein [Pyrinomonadaceae bacterium]|jgi:CxxC motif-containing protein (DUF1111 family)